jgi:predicted kinase
MKTIINLAGEVLILTGTPGAGKTTTASALADQPGSPKVHLHADDLWGYIRNGAIPPYLPESQHQNEVVMDALAEVAESFALGGYFVVLDGIIGPWFLARFRTLTVPLHYIVLRPPLDLAIQRCRERGGDTLADPGPITALHRQLSSLSELEPHVLLTEDLNRQELLHKVVAALQSGAFRLS